MKPRTLPFAVIVPLASGSDPDVIEIEDCAEVYQDFPEIEETCDRAPAGRCEYSWRDNWRACIHCGRKDA